MLIILCDFSLPSSNIMGIMRILKKNKGLLYQTVRIVFILSYVIPRCFFLPYQWYSNFLVNPHFFWQASFVTVFLILQSYNALYIIIRNSLKKYKKIVEVEREEQIRVPLLRKMTSALGTHEEEDLSVDLADIEREYKSMDYTNFIARESKYPEIKKKKTA